MFAVFCSKLAQIQLLLQLSVSFVLFVLFHLESPVSNPAAPLDASFEGVVALVGEEDPPSIDD